VLVFTAREAAGALGIRLSLRPHDFSRELALTHHSGDLRRENAGVYLSALRNSEWKQHIGRLLEMISL
jgi:hypothetical protein